jgi:hypothetical protein
MIATRGDRGGVVITPSWALPIRAPPILLSINGDTSGSWSSERHGAGHNLNVYFIYTAGVVKDQPLGGRIGPVASFRSTWEDADQSRSRR